MFKLIVKYQGIEPYLIAHLQSLSPDYFKIVEDIGVEPMTSCVQGKRSSQLS